MVYFSITSLPSTSLQTCRVCPSTVSFRAGIAPNAVNALPLGDKGVSIRRRHRMVGRALLVKIFGQLP